MNIVDKVKSIIEKIEPWQWAAGVAVAGIGLYTLYSRNSGNSGTAAAEEPLSLGSVNQEGLFAAGGDTSGNSGTGSYEAIAENVTDVMENQAKTFAEAFNTIASTMQSNTVTLNDSIAKVNEGLVTIQQGIVPAKTDATPTPTGTIIPTPGGTPGVAEKPASSVSIDLGNNGVGYNQDTHAVFLQTLAKDPTAYIAEEKRVENVIANRTAQGLDTSKQVAYAKTIQSIAPINLGNNGIGYNEQQSKSFDATMKSSPTIKAAEVQRVAEVIANRTAAGMDTSKQIAYEAKIQPLGNNGQGYNAKTQTAFEASLKTNTAAKTAELARVNSVIAERKKAGLDTTAQVAYLNKIK